MPDFSPDLDHAFVLALTEAPWASSKLLTSSITVFNTTGALLRLFIVKRAPSR